MPDQSRLREPRSPAARGSKAREERRRRGTCSSSLREDESAAGASSLVEKQFGKGAIMALGDEQSLESVPAIPTDRSRSTSRQALAGIRAAASSRCLTPQRSLSTLRSGTSCAPSP